MRPIIRLFNIFSKRRKLQLIGVLLVMIVASFLEVVSIGLVLPFLGILVNPELVYTHNLITPIVTEFNMTSSDQLIKPLMFFFIISVISAGVVRVFLLYVLARVSHAIGFDISINIYKNTLYQDYLTHLNSNSSEIINGVIHKTSVVVSGIISPVLTIVSSLITMTGIMTTLFFIDAQISSIAFFGFGTLYVIIIFITKKTLLKNGKCIADKSTYMIKALQEGLGGIRDVLINGSQDFYCNMYQDSDLPMRRASANNEVISTAPRYVMEALGMTLIAIIAYIMIREKYSAIIPILGTFALGAQRLMPVMQQIYHSLSRFSSSQHSLLDVLQLLERTYSLEINQQEKVKFNKNIILEGVSFQYSNKSKLVLDNVNLTIEKGSKIGIIGSTGSGKSTLVNVIMCLLWPSSGVIKIDGKNIDKCNYHGWQKNIAHVPQNIYLSDSSVKENIAFGISINDIDFERILKVAKQAHIHDFIMGLDNKYDSFVGEQGALLSGGQRQRIGLARALYKQVDVIVLDEATSALDNKTEQGIMSSVYDLNLCQITIIIIAHRVTTLKGCDKIVEMENNTVKRVGTYNEIIT